MKCLPQELFWGDPAEGFQIALGFEKRNFHKDEPVITTVVIKNTTDAVRQLHTWYPTPEWDYSFIVTRNWNEAVAKIPRQGPGGSSLGTVPLGAHVSETNRGRLDLDFDFSAPGTYAVTASRQVPPASGPPVPFSEWVPIKSGNAIIQVVQATAAGASSNSPSPTQRTVANGTEESIERRKTDFSANRSATAPGSSTGVEGSSPKVFKPAARPASDPLGNTEPITDRGRFTLVQTIGTGIIAAFLALLAIILLRAKARQKRSSP
jgi:hypothetical protein